MSERDYTLRKQDGTPVSVVVRKDKRLKKSARWSWEEDGTLLVRVPARMARARIPGLLTSIQQQLEKPQRRARRRTDADLQARAEHLNRVGFNGRVQWESIRWVPPMKTRLGSCTNGGSTDGHIRISSSIKSWPSWVIDYIIAHEMTHRLHPNHSAAFWRTLQQAYPLTERARGFIKGVEYSRGVSFEDDESPP